MCNLLGRSGVLRWRWRVILQSNFDVNSLPLQSATASYILFFSLNGGLIAKDLFWVCWWATAVTPMHRECNIAASVLVPGKLPVSSPSSSKVKGYSLSFLNPATETSCVRKFFLSRAALFHALCGGSMSQRIFPSFWSSFGVFLFHVPVAMFSFLFWGGRTPPCMKIFCCPFSALLMPCFWLTGVRWTEHLIPSPWQLHTWWHAGPGR